MNWCALLAFLALSCLVNLSFSQTCRPLNSSEFSSCIAANFTYTIDSLTSNYYVQKYSKTINDLNKKLDKCSPHISTVLCSLYVPKCVEGQFEPFLPCRRVCREFVYGCQDKLLKQGLSWLISLCPILPDETTDSGNCFEPEGFKPKHGNEPFIKSCDTSVDSIKKCTGYKTFWNASSQREINTIVTDEIKTLLQKQRNCSLTETLEKLVCAEYAPPCLGEDTAVVAGALCRSQCYSLSALCPSALAPDENSDLYSYCASTAEGHTTDGQFCQYHQWPSARHWPKGPWVKRMLSYFPEGFIAVLVLVPILAVFGICVAVIVRRKMSRTGAGYKKHSTTYDTGTDTVTFT